MHCCNKDMIYQRHLFPFVWLFQTSHRLKMICPLFLMLEFSLPFPGLYFAFVINFIIGKNPKHLLWELLLKGSDLVIHLRLFLNFMRCVISFLFYALSKENKPVLLTLLVVFAFSLKENLLAQLKELTSKWTIDACGRWQPLTRQQRPCCNDTIINCPSKVDLFASIKFDKQFFPPILHRGV